MKELVSVIIPIYKVEQYINECIDSVINQSYKYLEIILVNDGSPDNCGVICDEYASKDNRVKVIHKENGGLSDARNVGLDIATGEYIAFVDSDDVVHPQFIERLYSHIGITDMVFCDVFQYSLDKEINLTPLNGKGIVTRFHAMFLLDNTTVLWNLNTVVAWNKLYRRYLWDNLRYPNGKIHEDEFVIHHILYRCKYVNYLDESLYYYRQRAGSIIHIKDTSFVLRRKLDALEARKDRLNFAKKHCLNVLFNYTTQHIIYNDYISFYEELEEKEIPSFIKDEITTMFPNFSLRQKVRLFMLKRMKKILFLIRKVRH